jgi:predicted MFS family arabinose efflux permease
VVGVLNYADRQAIFSLFPLLRRDLAASDVALGSMASVFLWVYALVSPFAGYIGDRLRRSDVIIASLFLWSVVTIATGFATTSGELLMLRGLMGLSEACYMPAGLALIADYHGPHRRSTAIGIHQSGVYLGMVLGGVSAAYLGDHVGWRYAFYCLGGLGVLLGIFLSIVLDDVPGRVRKSAIPRRKDAARVSMWHSYSSLLGIPTVWVLSLVVMVFSVYFWILAAWLPLFFYQEFAMTLTRAAFTATAYSQLASVIGILVGGLTADYFRRRYTRARIWVQFLGIIVPAPFLLVLGTSKSFRLALTSMILFGLGRGVWDCNNMPILCDVVAPELRASAYGLYNFAGMLGGGVGTLMAGVLASQAGLRLVISSTGALAVVAGIMLWFGATNFLEIDMHKMASSRLHGTESSAMEH